MIEMPWPEKQVWPNFRQSHHWRSYNKQRKAQRDLACLLTKASKMRHDWDAVGAHIPLRVTITPPDNRRRDRDGMIGACKGILDGMSDAWGVNDQFFAPAYVFADPAKPGRVTVEVVA